MKTLQQSSTPLSSIPIVARHLWFIISISVAVFLIFKPISIAIAVEQDSNSPPGVGTTSTTYIDPVEEGLSYADRMLEKGDREDALKELLSIIERYPSSPILDMVYFKLSGIYISQHRWKKASDVLQILLEQFPFTIHRLEVEYRLALSQFNLGDYKAADLLVKSLLRNPATPLPLRERVERLSRGLTLLSRKTRRIGEHRGVPIGVILPLTGRYGDFGEAALKGILLGTEVFGPVSGDFLPVELIIRDSHGDKDRAIKAVEELVLKERVVAILGPLLTNTSKVAAKRAEELGVPLITFSQAESIAATGDFIFQNSLTPRMQAQAVADYAVNELGILSFGILYPRTSYGVRLANHFRERVERLGAEVVRTQGYDPRKKDFSKEIKALFLIEEPDEEKKEGDTEEPPPPVIDFDALYIPDYFDRVVLIAPQLAFYNVTGIQLLGSNGWDSPRLVELGERYVDGSVFVDGFFPDSKRLPVEKFVKDFYTEFEIRPGILEAQTYDTVRMLLSLIKEEGVVDRDGIRDSLKRLGQFNGVTGITFFNEDGEAIKSPYLLKVEGSKIVSLGNQVLVP